VKQFITGLVCVLAIVACVLAWARGHADGSMICVDPSIRGSVVQVFTCD